MATTIEQPRMEQQTIEEQITPHHLIPRGAAVESVAPLAKVLTETEFYTFAEKAFSLPEVIRLLRDAVNEHNRAEQKARC